MIYFLKFILVTLTSVLSAQVHYTLKCPRHDCQLIIYDEHQPMGTVHFIAVPKTSFFYLHSLFVLEEFRNCSVGTTLMRRALTEIKERKARKVFLRVGPFERKYDESFENYQSIPYKKDQDEYKVKIQDLERFYQNLGFTKPSFFEKSALDLYLFFAQFKARGSEFMILSFY